jgi:hypothetical protein
MADYIKADKVEFISMSEFKERVNEDKLEVVRNPNSGKLFLAGVESNWKVQAEYTPDKETRMLVPDGDLEQACVVNVKNTSEVLATF